VPSTRALRPVIAEPTTPACSRHQHPKGRPLNTRTRIKLGLVTLSAIALTACSAAQAPAAVAPAPAPAQSDQGQGSSSPGDSSGGGTSQASASLGKRSPEGGYWPASLQLGQNSTLGKVVLDGQGFTLYRFDKDTAKPSASNCSGSCLATWPPVLTTNKIQIQNLDPSKLGAITRQDGTQQVTVGGWPVYRYINDVVPGQVTGQGVGDTWFAVAPDGSKAGGGKSVK
jgi:predicted lipoprotein with Yx(FWY)xxD motif